jgi:uncharacterized membrane protein
MTDEDKFILRERIYPAIQSCVSNRYKIILGIFIYYGFILSNERIYQAYKTHPYFNLIPSIIFTIFIVHNFLNYHSNSKDRVKHEGGKETFFYMNLMEIIFGGATLILIWIGYVLFPYLV